MLHSLRSLQNYGLSMPKLNRISVTKSISLSEFIMQCPSPWMNETHMWTLIRLRYTLHFQLFFKKSILFDSQCCGRPVSFNKNRYGIQYELEPLKLTCHCESRILAATKVCLFHCEILWLNFQWDWLVWTHRIEFLWLEIQKECSKMGINYISRKKMSVNLKIPSW